MVQIKRQFGPPRPWAVNHLEVKEHARHAKCHKQIWSSAARKCKRNFEGSILFSFAVFHSPEKKKKSLILIHGMDDKIKFLFLFLFLFFLEGGVYFSSYFTEKIFKEVICPKYSWYNYVFSHLFFRITFCFHFIWGCTYKTILTNTDTSLTSILKQKPRLEWSDMHKTMLHRHYVSIYNSSCNLCCKSVVCKLYTNM